MLEKKIFIEIPKKANFHSVVMTTFSFDFHHFESQVLKPLKSKGIVNVNVFVDGNMLDQALGYSTGNIKYANTSYSINTIKSTGVFHPKITLLVGENEMMLIQGSGNITNGGHGKNHELFTTLYASKDDPTQLPLILEAWQYIKMLSTKMKGFSIDKLKWISNSCQLINDEAIAKHQFITIENTFSAALLYNENESNIWSQLTSLLPDNLDSISVFSPYYDENGSMLDAMQKHFNPKIMQAFLQPNKGIHPHKLKTKNIQFYNWNSTSRARKSIDKYSRKLHSKLFVFVVGNVQYCLIGSANATSAAFGSDSIMGRNAEFAMLIKDSNRDFIKELGLSGNYKSIKPQNINEQFEPEASVEDKNEERNKRITIVGADLNGSFFTFFISKEFSKATVLKFYDNWGNELYKESFTTLILKNKTTLKQNIFNKLSYIQLFNTKSIAVSNKYMVNDLSSLWNTNPSKENRDLLKLSSLLETGNNSIFDIISFFNTIETSRSVSNTGKLQSNLIKDEKSNITNLTYNEAIAIVDTNEEADKNILQHNTIKIWDAIEQHFNSLIESDEEKEMDEEEEGEATIGREREEKDKKQEAVVLNSKKVLEKRRKKIVKFLSNYKLAVMKSIARNNTLSVIDLAMYLIVLKHLLELVNKEVLFRSERDKTANKVVVYDVLGSFDKLDNFSGGLINVTGTFINLLLNSPFKNPTDTYIREKQKHYKNLARKTTLFALAISKNTYKNHENGSRWLDLMALNILKKLGVPEEDNRYYELLLKSSNLNDVSLLEVLKQINRWIYKSNNRYKEYLYDRELGICYITKRIPPNAPVKYFKIARPGFDFDENIRDFQLKDVYSIATRKLMHSRQEYKKNV